MDRNCLLYDDRFCNEYSECLHCDLDPDRLCDSCMKCMRSGADYAAIGIDYMIEDYDEDEDRR